MAVTGRRTLLYVKRHDKRITSSKQASPGRGLPALLHPAFRLNVTAAGRSRMRRRHPTPDSKRRANLARLEFMMNIRFKTILRCDFTTDSCQERSADHSILAKIA